jgi:hypothetical protein
MNKNAMIPCVAAICGLLAVLSLAGAAQQDAVGAYDNAVARWNVAYLTATTEISVQIDDDDPASYTMKLWLRGTSTGVSVIVASDADFLLGLAMLQEDRQVTAWWPSLQTSKTFDASQTGEEIGLSGGRLEQIGEHPGNYAATPMDEDPTEWRVEVRPTADNATFARAVVHVEKADQTVASAEFYDASGELLETDTVEQYTEVKTAADDTVLFPLRTVIVEPGADKTTTFVYTELAFPETIDDSVFTLDSLKSLAAQALVGTL